MHSFHSPATRYRCKGSAIGEIRIWIPRTDRAGRVHQQVFWIQEERSELQRVFIPCFCDLMLMRYLVANDTSQQTLNGLTLG